MSKVIDETGNRYGRLTVFAKDPNANAKRHGARWHVKCDCGKETTVVGADLRSGHTRSCGCLNDEKRAERAHLATAAAKLPEGIGSFRTVIRSYKHNAAIRNLVWNLEESEALKLMQNDCSYCGSSPFMVAGSERHNGLFFHNGLDRINSGLGYTINNVVSCCRICNNAKAGMSQADFINWIWQAYNQVRPGQES